MCYFTPTVVSVGAFVLRDDNVLVVRLTYSPTKGQYMFPGGVVEPGETLDTAVMRETFEETGIRTRPVGIIGVASIVHLSQTHTYVIWLLEPDGGTLQADGTETDHACFMSYEEIAQRSDVSYLVKYVAARVQTGSFRIYNEVVDYEGYVAGLTAETYRLFM